MPIIIIPTITNFWSQHIHSAVSGTVTYIWINIIFKHQVPRVPLKTEGLWNKHIKTMVIQWSWKKNPPAEKGMV